MQTACIIKTRDFMFVLAVAKFGVFASVPSLIATTLFSVQQSKVDMLLHLLYLVLTC